jgi:hypothetical protein
MRSLTPLPDIEQAAGVDTWEQGGALRAREGFQLPASPDGRGGITPGGWSWPLAGASAMRSNLRVRRSDGLHLPISRKP